MSLTPRTVENHIASWTKALQSTTYAYRRAWPAHLFRHEPVENAARILTSGQLLSRNDAAVLPHADIAAPDVLARQSGAYDTARLYFRPLNPTQYCIEGVRRTDEYYLGDPSVHAPVLVMFVFSARAVFALPNIQFSDGNMQSAGTRHGRGESFFASIDFTKVYHHGPYSRGSAGDEIKRARCAEVLAPSPLGLATNLKAVICRSAAERQHLIHLLGRHAAPWLPMIRIPKAPGIFFGDMAYVDAVEVSETAVVVKLHPRRDNNPVEITITVVDLAGDVVTASRPTVVKSGQRCRLACSLASGAHIVRVQIFGCLAHESTYDVDTLPF